MEICSPWWTAAISTLKKANIAYFIIKGIGVCDIEQEGIKNIMTECFH